MELSVQDDVQQEVERQLTPQDTLRGLWKELSGMPLFREKSTVQMRPDLVAYAGSARLPGWASPRAFALQGLAVSAIVLSLMNWYMTHDSGPRRNEIAALQNDLDTEAARQQGIMDATERERNRIARSNQVFTSLSKQEAIRQMDASLEDARKSLQEFKDKNADKQKDVYARQQAEAVASSGTPIIFALALVFAAGWIASGMRRDFPRANVRAAGDLYLYFATAEGIWLNPVFVVLILFALSGSAYGLTGFSSALGPLFWAIFWIGFYVLFARYLGSVARGMYKSLQIPNVAPEWSLENRMLVRLHNSFWIVFAALEVMLLSVSYLAYVIVRRFA